MTNTVMGIVIGIVIAAVIAGAMAIFNTWMARRAERRHPPRGRFIEVDGVRLHFLEQGRGPAVVLLHGNGTFSEDYRGSGLLDRLAARHRVVAIDRPGFGFSSRPRHRVWTPRVQAALLAAALDRLDLREPVVVAHSWGTLVAVALALDAPQRVRSLVLLSGYYYPTPRLDAALSSAPAIPVVGDVMRYTVSPVVGALMMGSLQRKIFGPMPVPDGFRAAVPASLLLRPWQLRAAAEESGLMVPAAAELRPRLGDIRMPVTVIAGADDRLVTTRRQSARLPDDIPGATLRVIPGIGHMVHYFSQDVIVAAVTQAVGGAETARPA